MIDVAGVPDRFENGVGEAQNQNVLRRLLAKKMIDPVSLVLGKGVRDDAI